MKPAMTTPVVIYAVIDGSEGRRRGLRSVSVAKTMRGIAAGVGAVCLATLLASLAIVAHAHPGGLNKEGCHNDRKNGGYHCHRAPAASSGSPPDDGPATLQPAQRPAPGNGRAYRNCDEARAAGAAPVRRGEPGYGPHLDRDNDGIGCEPYRGR